MFNKEFENKEILINGFRTYLENRNTKGIHCISSILRCSFFPHILISKTSHRPGFRSSYCREELLSPASHLGALWVWDHSNSPKVFCFFGQYGQQEFGLQTWISTGWPLSSQGSYVLLPLLSAKNLRHGSVSFLSISVNKFTSLLISHRGCSFFSVHALWQGPFLPILGVFFVPPGAH